MASNAVCVWGNHTSYFILFDTNLYIKRRKNAHITFSGDKIPHKENALVLANHQAWTDIYLIHSVANRRDMLYNCKVSTWYMQNLEFDRWFNLLIYPK